MKGRFKKFKLHRNLFKNKELTFRLIFAISKSFKKIKKPNPLIFKLYYYNNLSNPEIIKSFKGYSIHNYKRKGFYSTFQLNRFDIKKLISYRFITGLQSFYW